MTIWRLKKSHSHDKLLEKITLPVITFNKKHSSKQVASIKHTLEKKIFADATFEGLWVV